MTFKQFLSFCRRFFPQHFCSRYPRFLSTKFGAFLTMNCFLAFKLGYNHAQREMIIRRIESFQIFKILADSVVSQDVPQEYNDILEFLCDWLISTACRRQNIDLVSQAIEMGSYPACAVYALMVMQRRLPQREQMEALELLRDGNAQCCAHCLGALAVFCAFNGAIDLRLRIRFGGDIFSQFWLACRSASKGSQIGMAGVAKLLRFFATTSDYTRDYLMVDPNNEFLKSRFPELIKETLEFFQRTDREPYLCRGNMEFMAEELEKDLSGSYLKALLRF
jgi:hypothetical protein